MIMNKPVTYQTADPIIKTGLKAGSHYAILLCGKVAWFFQITVAQMQLVHTS